MGQNNHVVITRKEEKDLKKLNRLFEILGIDYSLLSQKVSDLKARIKVLEDENRTLKEKVETSSSANAQLIKSRMKEIEKNVNNKPSKDNTPLAMFNFKGNTIDEKY